MPCFRGVSTWQALLCVAEDGVVPVLTRLIAQFYHDVLDLSILIEGIYGHVFSYATLLVSAMSKHV
jgi:hypothetical protein